MYRNAEKGHVVAKWTINALALTFFILVIGSYLDFIFFKKFTIQPLIFILCMCTYAAALTLRFCSIATLNKFRSYNIELRRNQKIIKEGPYSYIRNPIYLSMLIEAFVIPMATSSIFFLFFAIVVYIPLIFVRLRIEEKTLLRLLGHEYYEYMKFVPSLIPFFK